MFLLNFILLIFIRVSKGFTLSSGVFMIHNTYDPNRPRFVPENAVWNKPKPNVEEELMEF
jgi:hypothetical protein